MGVVHVAVELTAPPEITVLPDGRIEVYWPADGLATTMSVEIFQACFHAGVSVALARPEAVDEPAA